MNYFQGVVTEYLRADRAVFVYPECLIQREPDNTPAKGRHWYCDTVAINLRESTAYLRKITYSSTMYSLVSRLQAWSAHWSSLLSALKRDCSIPEHRNVQPWVFIPEARYAALKKKLAGILRRTDIPKMAKTMNQFIWQVIFQNILRSGCLRYPGCRCVITAICWLGVAIPRPCFADELYQLHTDIDGDRKPEVIEVSTAPAPKDGRSRVIVKIGGTRYVAEFFSAESELPNIHVVAINCRRPQRQLLLETPEADGCIFHLLSYAEKKLVPLLRFDSGPGCQAPQPQGNGSISVSIWQGFWSKQDQYRLSANGKALKEEPRASYPVEVDGVAGKAIPLQGAGCPAHIVQPGTCVRVKLYDSKKNRYRIQTTDGGCGWIPAADVNTIDGRIKELLWAG